jgi:predicted ATPase
MWESSVVHPGAMDPERWQQVDRVVQGALDLEEAEREAYLDEACAGDAELRSEVEALLGFDLKAEPFLATPAVEWAGVELGDAGMVGRVLGPYRIEALVGEGGMGAVYRARDERLGRAVAIKVVRESRDTGLLRRFMQETRLASSLNHPNIVTVYDLLETDGAPLLVTEYVEGESLRARIGDGMETEEAVEVARQVASALSAAHGAGVVHRDVKPENVIVRADGLVKVLDFGIAKLVEGAGVRRVGARGDEQEIETDVMTAPGVMVGTVSYMSPEQARGEAVDGRTDVWSLGVMLYEMVAGHRPFRGPTQVDVLAAVMTRDPEPVEAMPRALAEVVERALRKRADERYATAGELASALEGLKGRLADAGGRTTAKKEVETKEQTARPTNLPEEREALIGRERELRAIVEELRRTRLLTVTGPGGTGKTRLATGAGRAMLHEFEDGVFLVELAAIRDPGLVASAVAQTLGVKEGGGSLEEAIAERLRGRELLVVLDNFEQVVDAAPFVARLLASAPRAKALVTSRERLHVTAEREFALSPLELPPAGGSATGEELGGYGAVALFVERARAVRPGFALDAQSEANRRAVAEICRRLDGLPLAIELAAARLRMLTPEALLGRLDKQLKLLTGGARDLPERQQTMRAAIAWSYDLLDENERALLRRLTVFSGGWSLDAAEAVCAGGDLDALDGMESLVDKSLVRQRERAGGEGHFTMLEVVREFGLEQLEASEEADDRRLAHARWYLQLGEEMGPVIQTTNMASALERLGREQENLASALAVLLAREPEAGTRLVWALLGFWTVRGLYSEGLVWFRRALESGRATPDIQMKLLFGAAEFARYLGDLGGAAEYARASAEACRVIDDRKILALVLNTSGCICMCREGEAAQARAYFQEGLSLAREIGVRRLEGLFLANLAEVALAEGDYAASRTFGEEALEIEGPENRTDPATIMMNSLGIACYRAGDLDTARAYQSRSLSIAAEFGNRLYCGYALDGLAAIALATGEAERSARLAGAAEALYESAGVPLDRWNRAFREEYVGKLGETLEAQEMARAWAQGRAMTLEEVGQLASKGIVG